MSRSAEDACIRSLRPPRQRVNAWRPIGVRCEQELTLDGPVTTLAIFLAGSECPFTCLFCDLWRFTLEEATPEGAIPAQIERVLAETEPLPSNSRVKLYNASNFFDRRAVPEADLPRISELLGGFERIVVECHPRLVGDSLFDFAADLGGRLEVAMGLETIHPTALPRLNKKMSKEDYDRAAGLLGAKGIPHRAFVLVGVPFVPAQEMVDWTVISAAYAIERGAETVTLIPVRGGNGELERLAGEGLFRAPTLLQIEVAIERALALPGEAVVQLDLWDLETFSNCGECFALRTERLQRMNLRGVVETEIGCAACEGWRMRPRVR